jgi:hypothetical protein
MTLQPEELEDIAVALAVQIEQLTVAHRGTATVGACCLVLAGLVRQARATNGVSAEHAIAIITTQLVQCVEQLDALERSAETRH